MAHINNNKIIEHYKKALSVIRTGLVNSSVLDHIIIEAYESKMKIIELSTVNKTESSQLVITPFDKSLCSVIAKAITVANIGVNPVDNGAGVILNFPPLTEETRKIKVKELKKEEELTKITVRQERQNILNQAKKQKESGEISEDALKKIETEVQKEIDNLNKEVEILTKAKEQELMKL